MTVERLLQSGDAAGALRVADELLAKLPTSPVALLGRARALLNMGREIEGELALDRALEVAPSDAVANTIRANLDAMYGRDADAVERLRPHALAKTAQSNEALLVLLDILYHSGRRDEWRELLQRLGRCAASSPGGH
jgi:Flp pilus assembly protein TadD